MMAKVLLVDDDARLLSGMARHLRKTFQVEMAENAREGMKALGGGDAFAAVVSDYQMPGMNGIEFLTQARDLAPETSRILLTGYSGLDMAIKAVNHGQIFRFLTKPCEPEFLELAIKAGVRQFHLLQSERVLLEQTLTGSVEAMVDLLGHLDTGALRKAQRITLLARRAASELGLADLWPLTVAAPMSQLALLALPLPLVDKQRRGKPLEAAEIKEVLQAYAAMAEVLERIPRLEPVAGILRRLGQPQGAAEPLPIMVQLLRGVIDLVDLMDRIPDGKDALARWKEGADSLDPSVVAALAAIMGRDDSFTQQHRHIRRIAVEELRLGHLLVSPIRTRSGRIVLPPGVVMDTGNLEILRDMTPLLDRVDPIEVIEPLLAGGPS